MYKLVKNYKNLENHMLNSQITQIERLEERSVLVKFYPDPIITDENSILNFLNLEQKNVLSLKNLGITLPLEPNQDPHGSEFNYCPANQQYFVLRDFLEEEYVQQPSFKERERFIKEKLPQQEFIIYILNRFLKLRLKNSKIAFEEHIENTLWNKLVIKYHSKVYKKFFERLEKPYKLDFLERASQIFLNRNLRRFNYSLNCARSQFRIFLKKFFKKYIYLYLNKLCKECIQNKRTKIIFLMLSKINHGGLIFRIPFLKEHIFIPYGFLKTRGKFSLDWVKYCLQWKIAVFFRMTVHSFAFKKRFSTFLNLIGRPCEKKAPKPRFSKKKPKPKNSKIKVKKSLKKKRYKKTEVVSKN